MGFLEWLGIKQYKPDYSRAVAVYKRMLDTGDLEKWRQSRMLDWQDLQKKAFSDIQQSTAARWGQTGADILGIQSSLPTEWTTTAGQRWMQEIGTPAMRSIEQSYLQAVEDKRRQAEAARLALEQQAIAEARAKTGAGGRFLAGLAGEIGKLFLMSQLGGGAGGSTGAGAAVGAGLGAGAAVGAGLGSASSPPNYLMSPEDFWRYYYMNYGNPVYYPTNRRIHEFGDYPISYGDIG